MNEMIRYPVVDTSEIMENKVFVAVGKEVNESVLPWALRNSGGAHIALLHVHQPADKIKLMGTKFPVHQLDPNLVATEHEKERQDMRKLLNKYKQICQKAGVCPEVHYIEMSSIEKGIVALILEHNVRRLVMGAAADRHYSRRMVDLRSRTAIYVRLQADPSCQIQFICKDKLIFTRHIEDIDMEITGHKLMESMWKLTPRLRKYRQGRLDGPVSALPLSLPPNTNTNSGQGSMRSRSVSEGQNIIFQPNNLTHEYRRVVSYTPGTRISTSSSTSSPNFNAELHSASRLNSGRGYDDWSLISHKSPSTNSRMSTGSTEVLDDSGRTPYAISEGSEVDSDAGAVPGSKEIIENPSPSSVIERGMNDELYVQLLEAMAEADNSRREAFDESIRRRKAEKDAIEAKRRVKTSENMYAEELRRRLEIDETLEKINEEHNIMKKQLDEITEELRMALEQKSILESQSADLDRTVQDLEHKMFSAVELLQNYKKERDELQVECDDALRLVEELREKQAKEASTSSVPQFYTEFDFSEIRDATRNFDQSLKIGEGGYGSIFRGFLRHTEVAIKMLHSHSMQGPAEFQQEVNVLSKLRHPNLVTLIGACPDAWIIVYEYLSGGSLEDRLNCKDNTPPLSWQNRIRIAAELCSVLIFLHSCGIVHGDLKPANLLLDKNLVSKLSDFGICRVLSPNEFSSNNTSLCCRTGPKGTFAYLDPEFLTTGELTSKSDTYSFGVILLRLLTGKPAMKLRKEVQDAINEGNLKNILDPTAGDWPFVQAQQLVLLAMDCCDVRKNRPDLASVAWRVLEPMRVSCGLSSSRFGLEGQCQIPHYFICPIFQEIMQDPMVAADGFTYEGEALRGWLDSGNNTSPMTNLELANSNLVPNHALRSAIQEWLQQP